MHAIAAAFIEAFTAGTGYVSECAPPDQGGCGGTIGESDSTLVVDGQSYHEACWDNA